MSPADLKISLESGTEQEAAAKDQLVRLVSEYGLEPWLFTRQVRIAAWEIPHSHPILTINTKYLDDDPAQVATFLHEQFHWLVAGSPEERIEAVFDEHRANFPDAPTALPEGADGSESSFLHLVVCDLEFQAMSAVFGETNARGVLKGWPFYTWIYEQVLKDGRVRQINERHGFRLCGREDASTSRRTRQCS